MSIDGTWNCILNGPMGKQDVKVMLTSDGGNLSGKLSAPAGEEPIHEGKVNGDDASWKCSVTKPMKMTLEFNVKISGDAMSGQAKLGMFGKALFSGTRG